MIRGLSRPLDLPISTLIRRRDATSSGLEQEPPRLRAPPGLCRTCLRVLYHKHLRPDSSPPCSGFLAASRAEGATAAAAADAAPSTAIHDPAPAPAPSAHVCTCASCAAARTNARDVFGVDGSYDDVILNFRAAGVVHASPLPRAHNPLAIYHGRHVRSEQAAAGGKTRRARRAARGGNDAGDSETRFRLRDVHVNFAPYLPEPLHPVL